MLKAAYGCGLVLHGTAVALIVNYRSRGMTQFFFSQNNCLLRDACKDGVDPSIQELLLSESPSLCDVNSRDKVSVLVLLRMNVHNNGLFLVTFHTQYGSTCLHTICTSFPKVQLKLIASTK